MCVDKHHRRTRMNIFPVNLCEMCSQLTASSTVLFAFIPGFDHELTDIYAFQSGMVYMDNYSVVLMVAEC